MTALLGRCTGCGSEQSLEAIRAVPGCQYVSCCPERDMRLKSAVIADHGRYRYRLDRTVQAEGVVFAYFGVNPSTADGEAEDATTRKWRGFTERNGGRRYIVGNVFAYRATDVRDLQMAPDPEGPLNDDYLVGIIKEADVLVPCWGNEGKVQKTLRHHFSILQRMLIASEKPIKMFGFTKDGCPKHPLMLGYDTPLVDWVPA